MSPSLVDRPPRSQLRADQRHDDGESVDGDAGHHHRDSQIAFQRRLPRRLTTAPPAVSHSTRSQADKLVAATICSYDRRLINRPQHFGADGASGR